MQISQELGLITLCRKHIEDISENLLDDVSTFLENTKTKNKFTPFGRFKTLNENKKDHMREFIYWFVSTTETMFSSWKKNTKFH